MSPFAGTFPGVGDGALVAAIELILKATVVFGVVALLDRLSRRSPAAQRHLLWSAGIVVALMLPLAWGVPRWSFDLLPAPTAVTATAWQGALRGTIDPEMPPAVPGTATGVVPAEIAPEAANGAGSTAVTGDAARPIHWPFVLFALWATGAALAILRVAAGFLALRRLERRARPLRDPRWEALAARCARDLGLTRRFALLRDESSMMPMAWGIVRSRVLVPAAADAWTEARRRVVLLHELAHVKRHDCLWQGLAQVATALYWFHPGAWYAAARLRSERERACDDEVLRADTRPSEYADHLLDVVRGLRGENLASLAAVSFARPNQFEGRLLAVLDPGSKRAPASPKQLGRVGLAAMVLGGMLAVVQPWATGAASEDRTQMEGPASKVIESAQAAQGLDARWNAAARAAGSGPYWIGYALPDRVEPGNGMLNDSEGLDLETLSDSYPGVRLNAALASLRVQPGGQDVALLFHVGADGRFDRVRMQSLGMIAVLARQPLYWLGSASDDESFRWLRTLDSRMPTERMKGSLVGLISIHRNGEAVVPYLAGRIRGGEPEAIRRESIEGLAHHSSPQTLAILKDIARTDRSLRMRREAIETMGRLELDEATDALLGLARSKQESVELRRQAVESLGVRATSKKLDALDRVLADTPANGPEVEREVAPELNASPPHEQSFIAKAGKKRHTVDGGETYSEEEMQLAAQERGDMEVRRQAVESLQRYPESVALPRLLSVVRGDGDPDVRRQAVETIGRFDTDSAFSSLVGIAWKDRDPDVSRQAVESIGRYPEERSIGTLEEVAQKHRVDDVRRQAVESLARLDSKRAMAFIDDLIVNDPSPSVQREAIDALRRRPAEVAIPQLQRIVREHPNPDIRRDAVDVLSRIDPDAALPVLEELIRGKKSAKR